MVINKHHNYFEHVINSLRLLRGSGRNNKILEKIIELAGLNDQEIERLHADGPRTVADYQLAWKETYLKTYGYIENSARGFREKAQKVPKNLVSSITKDE